MVTWAELRERTQRSILNDPGGSTWNDLQLHDFICYALREFALHTPYDSTYVINADTIGEFGQAVDLTRDVEFALPSNYYEPLPISETGVVWIDRDRRIFLDPANLTDGMGQGKMTKQSYLEYRGKIVLGEPIGSNSSLTIRYWGYYPEVQYSDSSLPLHIPIWAERAVSLLVAIYALESQALQSAMINQWKDRQDSGNPEHNALRAQAKYLRAEYDRYVLRHGQTQKESMIRELYGYVRR